MGDCTGAGVCARVALIVQHIMGMHRIILSSAGSLAPSRFPTLSHKRHDFRKAVTEHKMCVLILSTIFIENISHFRRIHRDIVINVKQSSFKVTDIQDGS